MALRSLLARFGAFLRPKPRRYDFPDAHRRAGKVQMPVESAMVPPPNDFPGAHGPS